MNKRILVCVFALAIMRGNPHQLLGGSQLPPDIEAEKRAFLESSIPLLALRAEEMQHSQSALVQDKSDGFYPSSRQTIGPRASRFKRPRKLISVASAKSQSDLGRLQKNFSAIPRALRTKSHKRKTHRKAKSKAKAQKHKASKGHKKAHRHRSLRSKTAHPLTKQQHRALVARISKVIGANKAHQAGQAPRKTAAQRKVENQLLRKILLDMDTRTANKLINQQTRALPGKPVHLTKRKLLQVLSGERKLDMASDVVDTIKDNLLLISAGVAIGGHFYNRRIDERHDRMLKRMNQMKGTLALKVGLMNEAVDLIDKINSQMKSQASRLAIEDEMYDKRFQSKAERIKNIPI